MPRHVDRRLLPYAPDKLFALVADIERYPEFLPWCQKAVIRERKDNRLTADLTVGVKGFSGTFTSLVTLERPKRITVTYAGGPLKNLVNEWLFKKPQGNPRIPSSEFRIPSLNEGCELTFYIDFTFRSSLLSGMMNPFFDKAFCKMAEAFERRARELYGAVN